MPRVLRRGLAIGLMLLAAPGAAQQFERVGDVQIHYGAVPTSRLSPTIAREHDIQRSPALALLNISVLEEREDGSTRPLRASVDGRVGVIGDQGGEPLSFRRLTIGDAPSQVAVFRIRDDEPMRFDLEVRHDRNAAPSEVRFIQRFHIDD